MATQITPSGLRSRTMPGLHRAGARHLRGVVWLTRDPLGLGPDVNPYRYVGNDPLNGVDPSGNIVIYVHGIQDTGKAWMREMHNELRKQWAAARAVDQIGIGFSWKRTNPVVKELPVLNGPGFLAAQPTVELSLSPLKTLSGVNRDARDALATLHFELAKLLKDHKVDDQPINYLAHSQGTMVLLAALATGSMTADQVVLLNSPLSLHKGHYDLARALKNTNLFTHHYYTRDDEAVRLINGGNYLRRNRDISYEPNSKAKLTDFRRGKPLYTEGLPSDIVISPVLRAGTAYYVGREAAEINAPKKVEGASPHTRLLYSAFYAYADSLAVWDRKELSDAFKADLKRLIAKMNKDYSATLEITPVF